jgi:hypothetical protein
VDGVCVVEEAGPRALGGQRGDVEIDAILDSRARKKPHVDLGAVRVVSSAWLDLGAVCAVSSARLDRTK